MQTANRTKREALAFLAVDASAVIDGDGDGGRLTLTLADGAAMVGAAIVETFAGVPFVLTVTPADVSARPSLKRSPACRSS